MTDQSRSVRAFISHAGEDKAEFAEPLARALRAKGIDAWLDKWEIRPGDSLIDKIFEEGLKDTAAVIVVLTANSVVKPWVQKELSVSVVRSITKTSRLIPVLAANCTVPESLSDLLRINWADKGSADAVAQEIADVLLGVDYRPPLGPVPKYLETTLLSVPGLTNIDSIVLELVYQAAMDGNRRFVQTGHLWPNAQAQDLTLEALCESIEVLIDHGYLHGEGTNVYHHRILVELPAHQLLDIARAHEVDVDSARRKVASCILNDGAMELAPIVLATGLSAALIEAIVTDFENHGFVKLSRFMGGGVAIALPSASFKRWFRDGSS